MPFLLDTNILIAMSKAHPALRVHLERHAAAELLLPAVAVAEIEYGIGKSRRREYNRGVFDAVLAAFAVVPFCARAARHYGEIRCALERSGQPIGPNDLLIAAQALALDATLVTDNAREFSRVPRLRRENWLLPNS